MFYRCTETNVFCRSGRDWIRVPMWIKNRLFSFYFARTPVCFSIQPYKQFYWHKMRWQSAAESVTADKKRQFLTLEKLPKPFFVKLLPLVIFSSGNWGNWVVGLKDKNQSNIKLHNFVKVSCVASLNPDHPTGITHHAFRAGLVGFYLAGRLLIFGST